MDRTALLQDRARGLSLAQLAKTYSISRTTVRRVLAESGAPTPSEGDTHAAQA